MRATMEERFWAKVDAWRRKRRADQAAILKAMT